MPVFLKAIIQIFKNSVFRFITYPITISLTLFLHPFPYPFPSSLTYPYPAFLVGKWSGWLMKTWRGSESSLHVPTKKMTVTIIERDQTGRHPSLQVFQGCMGRVPWIPYGGCAYGSNLAVLIAIPVFISDSSAKNYLCSRLSKFLAKLHCCKKYCHVHQLTPSCI